VSRVPKRGALLGLALAAGLLLFFLLGASTGGAKQVYGIRAGDLDAGSRISVNAPLRRGDSYMMGEISLKNVGNEPVLVESVEPQSTSSVLRATPAHIWIEPVNGHLNLPIGWPGWPPRSPPTEPPKWAPNWVQPHPNVLALPTSQTIYPGREAQLVYGLFLSAAPTQKLRITALRITFKQAGRTFLWTLPAPVSVS